MTFEEIAVLKKDEAMTEDEFSMHIHNLKRSQLHKELSKLVPNNCATVEAFPEAAGDYHGWILKNIIENPEIDTAITYLKMIQDAENVLNEEYNSNKYKEKRKAEYPDVMDYIDAQVKKANPSTLMEGMMQEAEYFEKCLAVKAKYPKGTK